MNDRQSKSTINSVKAGLFLSILFRVLLFFISTPTVAYSQQKAPINTDGISISDKNLPVLAIRDIHPNYEFAFLLHIDLMQKNNQIDGDVASALKTTYQRICQNLRETTYRPANYSCPTTGSPIENDIENIFHDISFKYYSNLLNQDILSQIHSRLANDLESIGRLNQENTVSQKRSHPSYPNALNTNQIKAIAASWLLAWAMGFESPAAFNSNNKLQL